MDAQFDKYLENVFKELRNSRQYEVDHLITHNFVGGQRDFSYYQGRIAAFDEAMNILKEEYKRATREILFEEDET